MKTTNTIRLMVPALALFVLALSCSLDFTEPRAGLNVQLEIHSGSFLLTGSGPGGRFLLPGTDLVTLSLRAHSATGQLLQRVQVPVTTNATTGLSLASAQLQDIPLNMDMVLVAEIPGATGSPVLASAQSAPFSLASPELQTLELVLLPAEDHPRMSLLNYLEAFPALDLAPGESWILKIQELAAGVPLQMTHGQDWAVQFRDTLGGQLAVTDSGSTVSVTPNQDSLYLLVYNNQGAAQTLDWAFVTPVYYTLDFAPNNPAALGAIDPFDLLETQEVTLPAGTFTLEGFVFAGWNTLADGSGTAYAAGDTFTMPAGNVTLYAQWTAETLPGTASLDVTINLDNPQDTSISLTADELVLDRSGLINPSTMTVTASAGSETLTWLLDGFTAHTAMTVSGNTVQIDSNYPGEPLYLGTHLLTLIVEDALGQVYSVDMGFLVVEN